MATKVKIHYFNTEDERLTYEGGGEYTKPYVSYVRENRTTHYNIFKTRLLLNDGRLITIQYNNDNTDSAITSGETAEYKPYITDVVIGDRVTTLGSGVFSGCTKLVNIEFSNSVTTIGSQSFRGCVGLTGIEIPSGVTSIGASAFTSCSKLTEIKFNEGLLSIGNYSFRYCSSLTSITIPDSVTSIGEWAFNNCNRLKDADFGNGIKTIGGNSFQSCSSLTSIEIPDSVTSIGGNAFCYNSSITSVTLGNSVSYIGTNAFYQNKITEITLPNSLKTVNMDAFIFTLLTDVFVPSGVTSIAGGAFASNVLSSITVDSNNTVYDSRDNCNAIIKTSTNALVQGCKATIIPNTVTSIGTKAFEYCGGLTSITIPNSVTNISSAAFFRCSNLQKIICNAIIAPTITNTTFQEVHTNGKLIVPRNSSGYETWMQNTNYYLGKYNWTMEELPYDAEIEYLESDGNQIIRDYDLILTDYDNTLETKMSILGYVSGSSDVIIIGAYTNSTNNAYMVNRLGTSNTQINVVWGRNAGNAFTTVNIDLGVVYDIKLYPTYGIINGSNITYKTVTGNQNTSFLRIFAGKVLQRLYSMKVTKNNNVILDLIPVRVGQVGYMYDKVSKQLLGNSGTGDFILGPDI